MVTLLIIIAFMVIGFAIFIWLMGTVIIPLIWAVTASILVPLKVYHIYNNRKKDVIAGARRYIFSPEEDNQYEGFEIRAANINRALKRHHVSNQKDLEKKFFPKGAPPYEF